MRKLLAPFDGSDNAMRALRYAISLARGCGPVEIHAVTAHDEPGRFGYTEAYVSRGLPPRAACAVGKSIPAVRATTSSDRQAGQ